MLCSESDTNWSGSSDSQGSHPLCSSLTTFPVGRKILNKEICCLLLHSDSNLMNTNLLQVMKFAVRYKRKALTFMSSVGVAAPLGRTEVVSETELGALLSEKYPASGGYAFG